MRLYSVLLFLMFSAFLGATAENSEEEDIDDEEEEEDTEPPPPDGPPLVPMCELVESYGYKCEEHIVTTKDGYKLDVYHVPPKQGTPSGPVVFCVHGLMASGEVWTIKNVSVAYQLLEQGNDVWIMNLRGTNHGRKHEKLNPDTDEEFWNYSMQDMALYDVPDVMAFVKEKTKAEQMYYIGHSMGTSIYFTMLSNKPDLASSIKAALLFAPIVFATKYQFVLKEGSSMADMYKETMNGFKENKLWEAFPRADIPVNEHQIHCNKLPDMAIAYCNMGFDMARPMVGDFMPAGTSRKNLEHVAQTYGSGKISFYDYGSEEDNKKAYGTPTPTEIDIKKATPPLHIFYCESDHLVSTEDVQTLKKEVVNLQTDYYIEDENFNHVDYLFPMSEETQKPFEDFMVKVKEIVRA